MIGTSVLKELNSYYKGILPKLGQYQGYNYYSCCKVVIFRACKLLVWCILRKMKVCFPECEKKSLSDVPREKWNYIKVPDQTWWWTLRWGNDPYDLVDIINNRRTVLSLSCIGKYWYLTKDYFPSDEESSLKKKDVKRGKTKTLLCQLSWIKRKWWHAYSKDFHGRLCKACILFNDFATNAPTNVTTLFKMLVKLKKIQNMKQKITVIRP